MGRTIFAQVTVADLNTRFPMSFWLGNSRGGIYDNCNSSAGGSVLYFHPLPAIAEVLRSSD